MTYRLLSTALLVAGFLLIGLAGYSYFASPSGPGLVVPDTDIQVADLTPGEETEVLIALENISGRPIRVLGLGQC
jgi:hypothetical protein